MVFELVHQTNSVQPTTTFRARTVTHHYMLLFFPNALTTFHMVIHKLVIASVNKCGCLRFVACVYV
jgi:hypothetical protein